MVRRITEEKIELEELCQVTFLSSDIVIEIVEHGIVDPIGNSPENWLFDTHMVAITRKAVRLRQDFDIDWAGISLAISLIDELEQLRNRNKALERRLSRFESNPRKLS